MTAGPSVAPMFFIVGRQRLFVDIDHIAPGQNFVQVLDASLNRCSLLLVLIGKRWARTGRMGAGGSTMRTSS